MKGATIWGTVAGIGEVTGSHLLILYLAGKYIEHMLLPIVEQCVDQCKNDMQCINQCIDKYRDRIMRVVATAAVGTGTAFEANDFLNYVLIGRAHRLSTEFKSAYRAIMVLSGIVDTLLTGFLWDIGVKLFEKAKIRLLRRVLGKKKINIPHMRLR